MRWAVLLLAGCGSTPASTPPIDASAPEILDVAEPQFSDVGAPACVGAATCSVPLSKPMIATCQTSPLAIVTDATNVYWTNFGHYNVVTKGIPGGGGGMFAIPCGDGALMKCAKSGCAKPTVLANGGAPSDLVLVGSTLVFADRMNGALMACDASGCNGAPNTYGAKGLGGWLRTDGTSLYFVDTSGGISTCKPPCASTTSVWAGPGITRLEVDPTNVYFVANDTLFGCSKVGCTAPTPIADVSGHEDVIAVDDTNVYFGGSNGIGACAKTGCTSPTIIATLGSNGYVARMTSDGVNVYWVEHTPSTTFIRSCPVTGCASTPVTIASAPATTFDWTNVHADGAAIYWTASQGNDNEAFSVNALAK